LSLRFPERDRERRGEPDGDLEILRVITRSRDLERDLRSGDLRAGDLDLDLGERDLLSRVPDVSRLAFAAGEPDFELDRRLRRSTERERLRPRSRSPDLSLERLRGDLERERLLPPPPGRLCVDCGLPYLAL